MTAQAYHPVCVVDCAVHGFIGNQIGLSEGDALGFKLNIMKR